MNPDDKVRPQTINAVSKAKPFSQMGAGEKVVHIGKVCVFFITAGFAFPTILSE